MPTPARVAAAAAGPDALAGTPTITLLSPNGFQQWEAGSAQLILYTAPGVSHVRIQLSANDGASWDDLATQLPVSGLAYSWTVPAATGNAYRIRIASEADPGVADTSDAAFSVVPPQGEGSDDVFFRGSLNAEFSDWSLGSVTAPSALERVGNQAPASSAYALGGNYSFKLGWTSGPGGDWQMSMGRVGWVVRDATARDSLILHVFSETTTPGDELPLISLADDSDVETVRFALQTFVPQVQAGAWQRLALPIDYFEANPGAADLTHVRTIVLSQRAEDAVPHTWYIDDVRMIGGSLGTADTSRVIVVLGSSTAAGAGASSPDSAWVGRYLHYIQGFDPDAVIVNLAVGGYTTYHVMPTGFDPPEDRPDPNPDQNITRALEYDPAAIIINLPSNDVAFGYSTFEQLANFDTLAAHASATGVPLWVTTCQPRDFESQVARTQLAQISDSILATFGDHAVDVYNGMAAADGTILPQYAWGDGIHINDLGHRLIFDRMVARGIWETLTTDVPDGSPDAGRTLRLQNAPNPVSRETTIRFRLPVDGPASLTLHDLAGRAVDRIHSGPLPAGDHIVRWNASRFPAGLYLYTLEAGALTQTRKLLVVR